MNNIDKKIRAFEILCGDWDFRNIDMTEPHLQNIRINDNKIIINCELFSTIIDDYVSCEGGIIVDKEMVKRFNDLDLKDNIEVLNFISEIEDKIDWDYVEKILSKEIEKEELAL